MLLKALTVNSEAHLNPVSPHPSFSFIQGKPGEPGKPGKDPRVSFDPSPSPGSELFFSVKPFFDFNSWISALFFQLLPGLKVNAFPHSSNTYQPGGSDRNQLK